MWSICNPQGVENNVIYGAGKNFSHREKETSYVLSATRSQPTLSHKFHLYNTRHTLPKHPQTREHLNSTPQCARRHIYRVTLKKIYTNTYIGMYVYRDARMLRTPWIHFCKNQKRWNVKFSAKFGEVCTSFILTISGKNLNWMHFDLHKLYSWKISITL